VLIWRGETITMQRIQITALPDEQAHPDLVIATLESHVARVDEARLIAYCTDVSAGLGDSELVIRVDVELEGKRSSDALEWAIEQDLRRRQLHCTVAVRFLEMPVGPNESPNLHTERDDVRRLMNLVPRGRVTTIEAIGDWMGTAVDRIAATVDELATAAGRTTPWHRVTAANGQLEVLQDARWNRLQAAHLESDGVPVRHGRVVGFRARFIDVVRLGSETATEHVYPPVHETSRHR